MPLPHLVRLPLSAQEEELKVLATPPKAWHVLQWPLEHNLESTQQTMVPKVQPEEHPIQPCPDHTSHDVVVPCERAWHSAGDCANTPVVGDDEVVANAIPSIAMQPQLDTQEHTNENSRKAKEAALYE